MHGTDLVDNPVHCTVLGANPVYFTDFGDSLVHCTDTATNPMHCRDLVDNLLGPVSDTFKQKQTILKESLHNQILHRVLYGEDICLRYFVGLYIESLCQKPLTT